MLKELLEGAVTKRQVNKIVDFIGTRHDRFKELLEVFFAGDRRVRQKTSHVLSVVVERNPALVSPYLKQLLMVAGAAAQTDAVKRNVMRILQFVEIPARQRGRVVDLAFSMLTNRKESVAVRVYAMTVLERNTRRFPELRTELRTVIEDELPLGSAGFCARGRRILKLLRASDSARLEPGNSKVL